MKRALQANINNKIFYIDEDAYGLLQNYLRQLSDAFSGPEGQEIVNDIECRVSELLSEKVEKGKNVIDIQCIYQVINTIGSPEELGAQAGPQYPDGDSTPPPPYKERKQPKKLYRSPNNRILGGVIGGLATYFGWDAGVMRILLVILALSTWVMPMVIFYLIAWMVIPLANTPRKKLEMEGREVTFNSVVNNLRDSAQEQLNKINSSDVSHAATTFLGTLCKILAGVVAVWLAAVGFASLIGLLVFTFFFFVSLWGDTSWLIFNGMRADLVQYLPLQCAWIGCTCLITFMVSSVLLWCIGSAAFRWKNMSKSALVTSAIVLAVIIAVLLILSLSLAKIHLDPFWF